MILAFLDHLEQQRHNTVRSRNLRLTALRAFLKFAARRDVSSLYVIERALGVPMKRFERPMLGFLSREEMLAVMGQPGDTWTSQRDHLLLAMLYNTGARVSEIIGVRVVDVVLDGASLRASARQGPQATLGAFVENHGSGNPGLAATQPNARGERRLAAEPQRSSDDARNVNQRLDIAVARAAKTHCSLAKRSISPHTIRHTTAMHLLQSGVDFSVIALWLGHESMTTTHRYVEADLAMKDKALARLQQPDTKMRRYHPPDTLMQFLQAL